MRKLLVALILIAAVPSLAGTIYVAGNDDSLYTIVPTTGLLTRIGSDGALGQDMYDLAETSTGILYAVSGGSGNSNLYTVNKTTGATTLVGSAGDFVNALVFDVAGDLYGAGNSQFYKLNTSTGHATQVGPNGAFTSSGDLEFAGNGTLYLTSSINGSSNDGLYSVNPTTGVATYIGNIGFPNVYGLAYDSGTMYGFSDGSFGQSNYVIAINLTTGVGTSVHTFTSSGGFQINGAADLPDPETPEPGTVTLMGLGIGLLAVGVYRRRRGFRQKSE